jgi:ElaB/YqjD/DUF883 family membrane-anchored ribosome-binding protein
MNTVSGNTDSLSQQGQDAADKGASTAQNAMRSTQRAADSAFDAMSEKIEDARGQVAPMLSKVSSQAEAAARRGMDAVRDTSQQLRERAVQASDMTVAYVKDEPVKAMLIAAATGAVLMALISMMGRSRDY